MAVSFSVATNGSLHSFTLRSGSTTGSSSMFETIFEQKDLMSSVHFGDRRSRRISRAWWSSTWRR